MFCKIIVGLLGYSVTSLFEKGFIEPRDDERTMTTAAVRAYYATNRINTHASNELLFIVLGVVLGVMMLVLCVVMVMCACKQRQQRRLLGNSDELCYHLEFRIFSSYFLEVYRYFFTDKVCHCSGGCYISSFYLRDLNPQPSASSSSVATTLLTSRPLLAY